MADSGAYRQDLDREKFAIHGTHSELFKGNNSLNYPELGVGEGKFHLGDEINVL